MESVVKQRLVGALVLLALGVVFWPIIFVKAPDTPLVVMEPMPPRPEVDTSPLPAPDSPANRIAALLPELPDQSVVQDEADRTTALEESGTDDSAVLAGIATADVLDPTLPRTQPLAAPALDDNGMGLAWVLQVATVSTSRRAERLRDGLSDKGYKAFVRTVEREGKTLYRVQIGPKVEREKLLTIKGVVDDAFDVNSAVLRYLQ